MFDRLRLGPFSYLFHCCYGDSHNPFLRLTRHLALERSIATDVHVTEHGERLVDCGWLDTKQPKSFIFGARSWIRTRALRLGKAMLYH